jgi:hypothetical protein
MPLSTYVMGVDGDGCMPTFSDPPYPFDCRPMEFASAFERYQTIIEIAWLCLSDEFEDDRIPSFDTLIIQYSTFAIEVL